MRGRHSDEAGRRKQLAWSLGDRTLLRDVDKLNRTFVEVVDFRRSGEIGVRYLGHTSAGGFLEIPQN